MLWRTMVIKDITIIIISLFIPSLVPLRWRRYLGQSILQLLPMMVMDDNHDGGNKRNMSSATKPECFLWSTEMTMMSNEK